MAKICQLCGEDCSDRPRTKDRKGRYFCSACYETAVSERHGNAPVAPAFAPEAASHAAELPVMPAAPTALPNVGARATMRIRPWWMSLALLCVFGLLAVLGALGIVPLTIFVIALLLYSIGVYLVIAVRAFGRSIGSGLLCLFVPLFIGYVGLVKDGSRFVRHLLVVASVGVVLLIGAAGVRVGTLIASGETLTSMLPPRVNDPISFRNPAWQFEYPGNWYIDMRAPGHDSYGDVTVEITGDSYCRLIAYRDELPLSQQIDASVDRLRPTFTTFEQGEAFTQWGHYQGIGRAFTATTARGDFSVRVFGVELDDDVILEAWEVCRVDARNRVEPGYALIRRTVTITDMSER